MLFNKLKLFEFVTVAKVFFLSLKNNENSITQDLSYSLAKQMNRRLKKKVKLFLLKNELLFI